MVGLPHPINEARGGSPQAIFKPAPPSSLLPLFPFAPKIFMVQLRKSSAAERGKGVKELVSPPPKRGRGRPRKHAATAVTVPRGSGRGFSGSDGVTGERRGFYFICLAHDQPSLFFSFLKMASQLFCFFCRITNVGLLAFLRPAGPEIFQDEEGCILPRKWAISNKKWAISNNKWAVK